MITSVTAVVRSLAIAALIGGAAMLAGGCSHSGMEDGFLAPPAYSAGENMHRQWRYAGYDWQQAIDDFDTQVTMTRPGSNMTHWNLSHSD
jgi:hypothetical protein